MYTWDVPDADDWIEVGVLISADVHVRAPDDCIATAVNIIIIHFSNTYYNHSLTKVYFNYHKFLI